MAELKPDLLHATVESLREGKMGAIKLDENANCSLKIYKEYYDILKTHSEYVGES